MTLAAALEKAARDLDAAFAKQQDEQMLRMIAGGVAEDFAIDFLAQRAEQFAAWRLSALADVRQMLLKEFPQTCEPKCRGVQSASDTPVRLTARRDMAQAEDSGPSVER